MTNQLTTARAAEQKELFVMLPHRFYNNEHSNNDIQINEFEMSVYLIVDAMKIGFYKCSYLNIDEIIRILRYFKNSSSIKKVKNALLKLQEIGMIQISLTADFTESIIKIDTKAKYYMRRQNGDFVFDEGFAKVFYSDIRKMLNSNVKYKDKLIRIYVDIMSYIFYTDTNARVAFPSIETIAASTGFDRKTVMNYITILCECEVLVCLQLFYEEQTFNYYSRQIHVRELKSVANETIQKRKKKYGNPRQEYKGNVENLDKEESWEVLI